MPIYLVVEDDRLGTIPKGWKTPGPMVIWQVIEDKTFPSGEKVLALTNHKRESGSVRDACWIDAVAFLDGDEKRSYETGQFSLLIRLVAATRCRYPSTLHLP